MWDSSFTLILNKYWAPISGRRGLKRNPGEAISQERVRKSALTSYNKS